MSKPQFKKIKKRFSSITLDSQIEMVRSMQDELVRTSDIALYYASQHLNP